MTSSPVETAFTGPHASALLKLADVIDRLCAEHDTSFVKAGDNKVYAFGGNGYIAIFDEAKWDGVIELITPKGTLSIKKDPSGGVEVTSAVKETDAITEIISDGARGLDDYYQNRYWSTPSTN
jgi:hypothetical protein